MVPSKPFLGSKPWAVVLCKFKDFGDEPHTPEFFTDWITRDTGGVNDFFQDVSYGKCNLDGSKVFGWFTLPYTRAEDQLNDRGQRIDKAAQAVQAQVDFTGFYGVCILLNVFADSGSAGIRTIDLNGQKKKYGAVVLDPWGWQPSVACQEISHSFGMYNHSRNASTPTQDYLNSFDIMSTLTNCYMFQDHKYDFGGRMDNLCGPGMNSPNLDLFGWIDADRIAAIQTVVKHNGFGLNRTTLKTFTVELAALNHPDAAGSLCCTIPASSNALGPYTYYLEYRTADQWDQGMTYWGNCVVIEQARSDEFNYLISPSPYKNCLQAGDTYQDADNGIDIKVLGFSDYVATLEITLPVHDVYKTPVAGPVPDDWHIYELVDDLLVVVEDGIRVLRSALATLAGVAPPRFDRERRGK